MFLQLATVWIFFPVLSEKIKRPLIIVTEYALTFVGNFNQWIL